MRSVEDVVVQLRLVPQSVSQLQRERLERAVGHLLRAAVLLQQRAQSADSAPTRSVTVQRAPKPADNGAVMANCRVEAGSKPAVVKHPGKVDQRPGEIRHAQTPAGGDLEGTQATRPPDLCSADLRFARRGNGNLHRIVSRNIEAEPPGRAGVG